MLIACNHIHVGRQSRRGIVLLVVITMLALFAVLGLAFVYYARSEADSAQMSTQAQAQTTMDVDPEFLLSYALGQLIYGVEDQVQYVSYPSPFYAAHNVYSSMRGHDLARGVFGWNRHALNATPFNGVGRPSSINDPDVKDPKGNAIAVDQLLNYRYFEGDGNVFGSGIKFIRDPGRYGSTNRNATSDKAQPDPRQVNLLTVNNPYYGENVPYTIATATDLSSVCLGQMSPDGTITARSFWRTTLNGQTFSLNPSDKLWALYSQTNANLIPEPWMKYASLRPLPYYNPNFPPPDDGGGDVKNVEFGPGISNGGTGYYRNDSVWIDLGFPVRVGPNGVRYKPLFAFFICDLDGKVNVNVAGNLRRFDGTNYGHASHRGFTAAEINLAKILNHQTSTTEWQNILGRHRYGPDQRPGMKNTSWPSGTASVSPYWGYQDADSAKNDPNNKNDANNKYDISEKLQLPGAWPAAVDKNQGKTMSFPFLSPDTYQNGKNDGNAMKAGASELYEHPWQHNVNNPGGADDDRRIRISNFEALWRYHGAGSPSLTSEMFGLVPSNLMDPDPKTGDPKRTRWRMLTPLSADFARPGISPWLTSETAEKYELALGATFPVGNAAQLPQNLGSTPNSSAPQSPNNHEFAYDFRGHAGKASGLRFDLARPVFDTSTNSWRGLTGYPAPDGEGRIDTTDANLQKAIDDRTQFAQNLFDRLRFVTTGARPGAAIDKTTLPAAEYDALRWLAQLAVNMVDYIDPDEVCTTFVWDTNNPYFTDMKNNPPDGYVAGTELPRVLINEVYAEMVNDPTDAALNNATGPAEKNFKVNFWVELINPLRRDPAGAAPDPYTVRLQVPTNPTGWPVYKVVVLNDNDNATLRARTHATAAAMLGEPDMAKIKLQVEEFSPTGVNAKDDILHFTIDPLDINSTGPDAGNDGFYVLGPQTDFPSKKMSMAKVPTATLKVFEKQINGISNAMTYELDKATDFVANPPKKHTILLRRLANPGLKHQADPTLPQFNPYVTVDYAEDVELQDGIEYDKELLPHKGSTLAEQRKATGRKQPYTAHSTRWAQQAETATMDQPWHSLFSHNSTLEQPAFDWLAHLDRNVVSPIELVHVSAFRQHELTQQFIDNTGAKHAHLARWNSSDHRLYRFLEYLDAGWRTIGQSQHGRVVGKININTMEKEAFRAVCDANDSCNFKGTPDDQLVDQIFTKLQTARNARPFKSLAAPYTTAGTDGVADTILRDDPNNAGTPLFQITHDHPTIKTELLSKIFNNITTRSNVFAVWLTVGFFEVNSEDANGDGFLQAATEDGVVNGVTANGLKNGVLDTDLLGKEVGREDNRHVRHRMFAIVDRTALLMPRLLAQVSSPVVGDPKKQPETVQVDLSNNPIRIASPFRAEYNFYPQAGMTVDIDTGNNRETVTIQSVDYTKNPVQFTAVFAKAHAANALISVPQDQAIDAFTHRGVQLIHGNPGPQLRFDHRQNMGLVPYFSVIQ